MESKNAEGDKGTALETTFLRSSEEPDVTITVGGKVFREYRQQLRSWSDYFDAAFRSGMIENITKSFEFPDRNPKEWSLIMSLVAPCPTERITKDNVYVALSWFDELCSSRGSCDKVLCADVIDVLLPEYEDLTEESQTSEMDGVLHALATVLRYDLKESKRVCFEKICRFLNEAPHLLQFEQLVRIVSFLQSHEECQSALWVSVKAYVPSTSSDREMEFLVKSDLFPSLLFSEIRRMKSARNIEKAQNYLKTRGFSKIDGSAVRKLLEDNPFH